MLVCNECAYRYRENCTHLIQLCFILFGHIFYMRSFCFSSYASRPEGHLNSFVWQRKRALLLCLAISTSRTTCILHLLKCLAAFPGRNSTAALPGRNSTAAFPGRNGSFSCTVVFAVSRNQTCFLANIGRGEGAASHLSTETTDYDLEQILQNHKCSMKIYDEMTIGCISLNCFH